MTYLTSSIGAQKPLAVDLACLALAWPCGKTSWRGYLVHHASLATPSWLSCQRPCHARNPALPTLRDSGGGVHLEMTEVGAECNGDAVWSWFRSRCLTADGSILRNTVPLHPPSLLTRPQRAEAPPNASYVSWQIPQSYFWLYEGLMKQLHLLQHIVCYFTLPSHRGRTVLPEPRNAVFYRGTCVG